MKVEPNDPPREFTCGYGPPVVMKDCAHIELQADEQITLRCESGAEYDVARKNWGFYATPSTNGRLQRFGFRTALVRNRDDRYFVLLVEQDRFAEFYQYLEEEGLQVVLWLDDPQTIQAIEKSVGV